MTSKPDSIRFYTDENVHGAVVTGLRLKGFDIVSAHDAGMRGKSDPEHLALAATLDRVLLTEDHDFLVLALECEQHSGVVYVPPGRTVADILEALEALDYVMTAAEIRGKLEVI